MRTRVLPVPHTGSLNVTTLILSLADSNRTLTGSPVHQHGTQLEGVARNLTWTRLPLYLSDRLSHRSRINDNYCVNYVAGNHICVYVTGKRTCVNCVTGNKSCVCVATEKEMTGNKDCSVTSKKDTVRTLTVNSSHVVTHAHFANGYPQKKGVNPSYCYLSQEIKHVNDVSCVDQLRL